jgi:hypothetical protein
VGGFNKDGVETRWALLGAGTWVIEGSNLSAAEFGECEWSCVPLYAEDGYGVPDGAIFLRL